METDALNSNRTGADLFPMYRDHQPAGASLLALQLCRACGSSLALIAFSSNLDFV